jgi:GDP/UDP-N,N'-diacetylbacillosamine 2-epimerase (hydrolysing)
MVRKVCVVTGSRAEFGLLRKLLTLVEKEELLCLQLIVTGTHLSPEFGCTVDEIRDHGFEIARELEVLLSSDSRVGTAKSIGLGLLGFADAFSNLSPNIIVLLGDRFEIFAAAAAAHALNIPILHIHGGEVTAGALDDGWRHAITKMARLHCVATDKYRQRVIQMGESPQTVWNVGGLGIDVLSSISFIDKSIIEERLSFKFLPRNLLITYHPETLSSISIDSQIIELLSALKTINDTGLIFSTPNADSGGRLILARLHEFVRGRSNSVILPPLGQDFYLSCLKICDGMVGNSSSGILEASYLKLGVVNVGNRQCGRVRASNVIDCPLDAASIRKNIRRLFTSAFTSSISTAINPYGDGKASERIVKIIKAADLDDLTQKNFFDFDESKINLVS